MIHSECVAASHSSRFSFVLLCLQQDSKANNSNSSDDLRQQVDKASEFAAYEQLDRQLLVFSGSQTTCN